jgi:YD repeat-containing protein
MADALARSHPVTAAGLRQLARRHPGVRGVRRVFEVARWMRPGAESLPESRLRLALVLRGVPEPVVQLRITDGPDGRVFARPDLAWREYRVEYDGDGHLVRERRSHDIDRDDRLRALGWVVLRVMADQLRDPDAVAERVLAELRARGWRP